MNTEHEYFTFNGRSQGPRRPHMANLCLTSGAGLQLAKAESEAALHKRTPPRELSPAEVLVVEVFPNPPIQRLDLG